MSKARIVLPIEGMTCASCAATVQEALTGASGVTSAGVNFATNKAAIEYDAAQTNVGQLIKTVRAAGYDCGKASVTFGITDLHYADSVPRSTAPWRCRNFAVSQQRSAHASPAVHPARTSVG